MTDGSQAATPADHEAEIRALYERLSERELAEAATSTLAVVLHEVGEERSLWERDDALRVTAAVAGGIRAFRAVRAGMAILACGYEVEADAMSRVLLELFVETRAAVQDASGNTAKAWLAGGRMRGVSSRVKAAMPDRPMTYGDLSHAAHGDPRALVGLAVSDGEDKVVEWGPRQTAATARCLIGYAVGARDMAVLVEEATDQSFAVIGALDHVMVERVPGWRPDNDWSA
jgi:hypothetical protein